MKKTEIFVETLMFKSRWLLAPFFFGLIVAIMAMLVKFGKQLVSLIALLVSGSEYEVIVAVLSLIDTALIASLLLIGLHGVELHGQKKEPGRSDRALLVSGVRGK